MGTVLVVEDDADIRVMVANSLRAAGHTAMVAATGRAGLELARRSAPDVVILDMMLPDMAGAAVVEALTSGASTRRIPIIILSARAAESDRIKGLELGAEDYVTKPFSPRELVLRANIAMRRVGSGDDVAVSLNIGVDTGGLKIDAASHRVFVNSEEVPLTPTEFRLLAALAGAPDRVLSRQSLLADVWGMQPNLETRTVDTHIKRLRVKLGQAARLIETVRGIGYRFKIGEDAQLSAAG